MVPVGRTGQGNPLGQTDCLASVRHLWELSTSQRGFSEPLGAAAACYPQPLVG